MLIQIKGFFTIYSFRSARFLMTWGTVVFFTSNIHSQFSTGVGSVHSYTGSKIRLEVGKTWTNHSLSLGVQYLHNSRVHDLDPDNYFKKRFYATLSTQHLGMSLTYSYEVVKLFETIPIAISYDFQFVRADLLDDRYIPKDTIDAVTIYTYQKARRPVTIGLENNICLEVKIPLSENLFLNHKFGGGLVTFHGIDHDLRAKLDKEYDFGTMFFMGLIWSFNKIKT